MDAKQDLLQEVPDVRRFARSLFGSQLCGNDEVDTISTELMSKTSLPEGLTSPRVALFRELVRSHKRKHGDDGYLGWMIGNQAQALSSHDLILPEDSRMAFLLSYQERFAPNEVLEILEIEELELEQLLEEGREAVSRNLSTGVLIIEDEMFIAMQLEELVRDMGHWVLQVARTRDEVTKVLSDIEHCLLRPGLILADVQLADGSSGIDAVRDHAVRDRIPVIFITSTPEKLYNNPIVERNYILRKPWSNSALNEIISQALYFR